MTTNDDIKRFIEEEDDNNKRLIKENETRARHAFLWAYGLCLCAVILPLFSALGCLKPQAESLGQWFARSGAMMTVLAVFAQFKAASIAPLILGSSPAFYYKYKGSQAIAAGLSLVLVILGTIVWGYGDLLFPLPHTK